MPNSELMPAGDVLQVVREAAHQLAGAVGAESGQVHAQRAAVELLAQIEGRQAGQLGNQDRMRDEEERLDDRADNQHEDHHHQREEGILRHEPVQVRLHKAIAGQRLVFVLAQRLRFDQFPLQKRFVSRRPPATAAQDR